MSTGKYLIKVSKGNTVAHVWNGSDTACRMWTTGGMGSKGFRLADSQMGRRLCSICMAASGAEDDPGRHRIVDANEALRALELPPGVSRPEKKRRKERNRAPRKQREPRIHARMRAVYVNGVDVASREFLETYEWRVLRMQALKRYGARCQCCGASPATGATMNVDHIKPRRLFPHLALDLDNLQVLCHDCNHGKGNWDQTDWREPPPDPEVLAMLRDIAQNG